MRISDGTADATGSGWGGVPTGAMFLAPPVIWAARIGATYVLIPYVCRWDAVWLLHAITLVSLLLVAVAGGLAWRVWSRTGRGTHVDLGGATTRDRFLALLAIFTAGFFFLVVVAEGLTNFFVDPCQTAGRPLP